MNKSIVVFAVVAGALGVVWWLLHGGPGGEGSSARPAQITAQAPANPPPAQVSLPKDEAPDRVATPAPAVDTASKEQPKTEEQIALAEEQAAWVASYGEATKAELERVVAKFQALGREERDTLFVEFAQRSTPETVWSDFDADATSVEQRFARPGLLAAAHLVERDKQSQRAQFQVVYLTAEDAPELANTERLLGFLAQRVKSAKD